MPIQPELWDIFLKTDLKLDLIKCVIYTSIISVLLVFYSNINRPDSGLYHLPYNAILNENKILLGIYNINFRFAHISSIQYLSGIYNNNFFPVEFLTLPIASIFSFYFFFSIKKILYYSYNKDNYLSFIYLLLLIFFFKALKKISIKILFGSPATIIIGLNFFNFKIFFNFVKIDI